MHRTLAIVIAAAAAARAVPHHGAYTDPNHYTGPGSWAGTRFIQEGPPHVLHMLGCDDGQTWWMIKGTCSDPEHGPPMSLIKFDFSPKGGPKDLTATAKFGADGIPVLVWADGNTWKSVPRPNALTTSSAPSMLEVEAKSPADSRGSTSLLVGSVVLAAVAIGAIYHKRQKKPAMAGTTELSDAYY